MADSKKNEFLMNILLTAVVAILAVGLYQRLAVAHLHAPSLMG